MQIWENLTEVKTAQPVVLTVGVFDGIHRGHSAILSETVYKAKNTHQCAVAMTFEPHPREVTNRGSIKRLTTLEERNTLIEKFGFDHLIIQKFTNEFSQLSPKEFYTLIKNSLNVTEVVVGYDHTFGKNRTGSVMQLEEIGNQLGFSVTVVQPVQFNGIIVNSTRIRQFLLSGKIEEAEQFLGRPYSLSGTVINGDGRGNKLGFPTANIRPGSSEKLIPMNGVYLVRVDILGEEKYGMLNIGCRPTFNDNRQNVIETHIFDFNENIINNPITVHFLRRLRNEKKFKSADELITQLKNDSMQCLKYLEKVY